MTVLPSDKHIIIFDGVCNFCNSAVNFIIKRDPNHRFVFTPMQSAIAQQLIAEYMAEKVGFDTFVLIKHNQIHYRTDAAFEICKDLSGFWHLFNLLRIIPMPVLDYFYRLFARNRYNLFGRRDTCMAPTPELRKRFLD